jgi:hypothetical protein
MKFYLHRVLHALSINQKSERMSYSKLVLTALMEQKASNFQRIITGDESCFFLDYPRDSVWTTPDDGLSQRIKREINTKTCLISVLWSDTGIHSLLDVPKGTAYNPAFFADAVMPSSIKNARL